MYTPPLTSETPKVTLTLIPYTCSVDSDEYQTICTDRKEAGAILFRVLDCGSTKYPTAGEYELEPKCLFGNQMNTRDHRLFDWFESFPPGAFGNYRRGYYIRNDAAYQQLQAMRSARYKCGYCGYQTDMPPTDGFCHNCLESKYLEEKDIHLLEMRPVAEDMPFAKRTKTPPANLIEEYAERQRASRLKRLEAAKDKSHRRTEKEYDGFKRAIEAGLAFDNLIFYSHRDMFCFGWHHRLSDNEKNEILSRLSAANFPYKYELK